MPAKKSVETILIESVDTETNGRRAGETHFHLDGDELFLDYKYLTDQAAADAKVDEISSPAMQVLERSKLAADNGEDIVMVSVVNAASEQATVMYCLRWSNKNKFTKVCGEAEEAIIRFRNRYEL